MPKSLRVGIIGVGHFGYFHAQKAASHPLEEFIGVFDLDQQKSAFVAKTFDVFNFPTVFALIEAVDAVFIATPATTHFTLAKYALEMEKHVFLEKPLSVEKEEGEALVALAKKTRKILQVGHLVAFSLPPQKILEFIPKPIAITMKRSVPFSERGCDVSVILDLMIHDLEFLFTLMGENGKCLHVTGQKIQTQHLDEVTAGFLFKNQCRVALFASRAASKAERCFLIEDEDSYLEVNFITHDLLYFKKGSPAKQILWKKKDLLWEEHTYFVRACLEERAHLPSLESAYQALCMAKLLEEKRQITCTKNV